MQPGRQPGNRDFAELQDTCSSSKSTLVDVLQDASTRFPGRALLLLHDGAELPTDLLTRWQWWHDRTGADALTCCTNMHAELNPFGYSGDQQEPPAGATLDPLVANTSKLPLLQATIWPQHLLWLSDKAVRQIQKNPQQIAVREPLACGVKLIIADDMFSRVRGLPLWTPRPDYAWDMPPAEAVEYRAPQLQQLLTQQCWHMQRIQPRDKPAVLHISHSWGGGVQRWVDNYCHVDHKHTQLVLKSHGFWKRKAYGSRMSLHLGGSDGPELMSWWLTPAIASTSIRHVQYQQMLQEICNRYQVQRVLISSLIGHSLEAMRCNLPSIHVVHDYYPVWPLLSIPPGAQAASEALPNAMAKLATDPTAQARQEFSDRDARGWLTLAQAWQRLLRNNKVALVAPGTAARQQLMTLLPGLVTAGQDAGIDIIEHGLAGWPRTYDRAHGGGRPAALKQRLKLVILGRLNAGKGLELLLECWPLIQDQVHLSLLGCGRSGRELLGKPDIDVIMEYDWQDLPKLIKSIQPDAGLLLSTVSETFCYTLSELLALGIPVIATRRGSFNERVQHQHNGLLIEPQPQALLAAITSLRQDPGLLEQLRQGARASHIADLSDMLNNYEQLWQRLHRGARHNNGEATFIPKPPDLQAAQVLNLQRLRSWQSTELTAQQRKLKQQSEELSRRAAALQRQRQEIGRQTTELTAQQHKLKQQSEELSRRAAALQRQRQEIDRQRNLLQDYATQLKQQSEELSRRAAALQRQRQEIDRQRNLLQDYATQLQQTRNQRRALQAQLQRHIQQNEQQTAALDQQLRGVTRTRDQMLASRSWKLTRPLRVMTRLMANLRRQRAYAPLRWPQLMHSLGKTISSYGWRQALLRLQANPPQAPGPMPAAAANGADVDQSLANTPVHWQAPETIAGGRHILVCVPAPAPAIQSRQLLPMLHDLQRTMPAPPAVLHIVVGDPAVAVLLRESSGIRHYPDLSSAVAALLDLHARQPLSSLLLMTAMVKLRADTIPQLYQALAAGHELIAARCDDTAVTGAATPVHPRLGVCRPLTGCSTDLLLLNMDNTANFLHHCEGIGHLPGAVEKLSSANVNQAMAQDIVQGVVQDVVQDIDQGQTIWQQSLASYTAVTEPASPALSLTGLPAKPVAGTILVVDVWVPMINKDSGSLRMFNLLKLLLELGWRVLFIPLNLGHAGNYTEQLQSIGVEVWYQPWIGSWKRFLAEHGKQFDLVLLSRLIVARELQQRIRCYCPQARLIYDTVDLHYLREQRQAELQHSLRLQQLAEQTRHQELNLMQQADLTLVVSSAEQQLLHAELPAADIRIISNIHAIAGPQQGFSGRRGVLFVGGFQHPPNIDAAVWLAETIWPLVRQQLDNIELHLIGSNANERIYNLAADDIIVHGFVEDLEPWLDQVRLTVAPLRYGAGVKGKINSSMSRGVPVVATTVAAEGMFMRHEHDVLLADSAADFAAAICRLHEDADLWQQLSDHSIDNVREHFSIDRARADLRAILADLQPAQPAADK